MMKTEFENLLGSAVTESDYNKIELAYMFYPGIDSKQAIVDVYKTFGMTIIEDMQTRSKRIRVLEETISNKQTELSTLRNRLENAKSGE